MNPKPAIPIKELNAALAEKFSQRSEEAVANAQSLVARAQEARDSMDVLCEEWKKSWFQFQDGSADRLVYLRQMRMATEQEMRALVGALREVRQFFLDKDHDAQVARLREFIDLCERLQKLKASGFLDTVADTLIKLA